MTTTNNQEPLGGEKCVCGNPTSRNIVHRTEGPCYVDEASEQFATYFAKNYPANTIISDPAWHAPRIFRAAKHVLASQPQAGAAGAERAVPEGWTIKRMDNGTIIVRKDDVGGCTTRQGAHDIVLNVLWSLANDLLAAPSPAAAKEGWKTLADDDKPDVTRKIDVVLTNGVTLENGDYRKIDWTQVRNWRYSPTQQTSAKVDAEGGAK